MCIYTKVKKRFYQDSLKLMRVSAEIKEIEGIEQAFAFMGTDINKKTRMQGNLISQEVEEAGADDLILLVQSKDSSLALNTLELFEDKILSSSKAESNRKQEDAPPVSFDEGILKADANLAVISVPGVYASTQAIEALNAGMNVQLFSDNVTIDEEIALKDLATQKDLLVMGPDCGTSIIGGVPICFANKVKSGTVGIAGASGTGLQEFTVLLDAAGYGITHAIGTGGRDLSEAVAGRTTLAALKLLAKDPQTEILVVISKPPAQNACQKVIDLLKEIGKPSVLAFLGQESTQIDKNIFVAGTIEEAVAKTVALCANENPATKSVLYPRHDLPALIRESINKLSNDQKIVKGLYTGGTLASEAKYILRNHDSSIIDLGDDEYTRGNVHPMIDPSNRTPYVLEAFSDPQTAVLLCDVVIGYGSHKDPASILANDIQTAREKTGANIIVIASVTGTDSDPQNRKKQVQILEEKNIFVCSSNQYAAEMAAQIAEFLRERECNK